MSSPELAAEGGVPELQLTRDLIITQGRRFLPMALALVGAAFLFGYVLGPYFSGQHSGTSGLTIAVPDLPVVEPLILKNVSKDVAKKVNDATPLTVKDVVAAAPFFVSGTPESRARATDCLAATIYYEAGAEAVEGQMAVVQVVLNRVRHPAYPKSVCGVVFQGHDRRTGCQFSYTCDGSMDRHPPIAAWERYRGIARAMLGGLVYAPVGLATHYHTDWVLPAWSAKLDKVRVERTHLFFRYHGYWGTRPAFNGRYLASEPSFAKLGSLSFAHRTPGVPVMPVIPEAADTPETALDLSRNMPDRVSETITPEDKSKDIFIIYVDPLLDPESLVALGERACGNRSYCKVLAWSDDTLMPKGLPIDSRERASMSFTYLRDRKAGLQKKLWNCALFPRERKSDCMPHTYIKLSTGEGNGAT